MREKITPTYYRLALDDCSAPSFTSIEKDYYGTLDDFQGFFTELACSGLLKLQFMNIPSLFHGMKEGQQLYLDQCVDCGELVGFESTRLLHSETVILRNFEWKHTNTWGWPYMMCCEKVESEHLWLDCNGNYRRVVKAVFTGLRYTGPTGRRKDVGTMLWGFPCILTGDSSGFWNRLAEPEKHFKTMSEAQLDWTRFSSSPDPDYKEFCNDIFGNG